MFLVNLEDTKKIQLIYDWVNISRDAEFQLETIEILSTLKRTSTKNENKLLIMKKK